MYIECTGRRIADKFGENRRSVEDDHQQSLFHLQLFCPVIEHFNLPDHNCISDLSVSVIYE